MARGAAVAVLQLLILALASSTSATAFNITRILGNFSDLSTFNDLLTRTKLADEINRRQTITVLALDNGAMGSVSSLPSDVQRKVLAVHIILDYYDKEKLGAVKNRSVVLTTLFQSTGEASNRMGFINFTKRADDNAMVFGSAEPGAPSTAELVKSVASRPYNISVMQVSSAIVPPSIGSTNSSEARPPSPAMAPSPSTLKTRTAAPAPSSDSSIAAAPADSPAADGPAEADGPVADGPTEADGPVADSPVADGPTHQRSSDDVSAAVDIMVVLGSGLHAMLLLATIISL